MITPVLLIPTISIAKNELISLLQALTKYKNRQACRVGFTQRTGIE